MNKKMTEAEIIGAVAEIVGTLRTLSEAGANEAIAEAYRIAGDKAPVRAFVQIVEVIYHGRRA